MPKPRRTIRLLLWTMLIVLLAWPVGVTGQDEGEKNTSNAGDNANADPNAANTPGVAPLPGGADVAIIRIEGVIYDFTLESLKYRVEQAVANGAGMIVIELNTPGGVATSALDISRYIKEEIDVPTIAWVNNTAYSAGILIAAACDRMIMSPAAQAGDCAPIVPGMDLAPTERAKALSPLLAEFEASAENAAKAYPFAGDPYVFYHAMCVLQIEIFKVQHDTTGEIMFVNRVDYEIMVNGESVTTVDEKLDDEFDRMFGPMRVGAPENREATLADKGQWSLLEKVHNGSTLLTVNQRKALDFGLAVAGDISDQEDVKAYLAANSVIEIDESWSTTVASWLVNGWVRFALIVILVVFLVIEMMAPGIGWAGGVALGAFLLLVAPPFIIGLAEIWHLILMFIGFILILVEIFVIPGFGVAGVAGIVCMLAGFVLAVVPTTGDGVAPLPAPEAVGMLQTAVLWVLGAVAAATVAFYLLFKHYGRLPILGGLVLAEGQTSLAALRANPDAAPLEDPRIAEVRRSISGDDVFGGGAIAIGAEGRAVMDLRPVGRAEFGEQIIDVETSGEWIERGYAVRVIEMRGNRIFVEAV